MNATADTLERDPPDDELLAAELALGVLDARARRDAQRRERDDAAFAARVAGWERHFGEWVLEVEPAAVPEHVWTRLRARLGWNDVAAARPGFWTSLAFWRGLGVAGVAAAIVLSVLVLRELDDVQPLPSQPPVVVVPVAPAPVVTLASDAGNATFLVTVDRKSGHVRVVPVPTLADAAGRVPELWLIPPGQAPRSLGLVDNTWTREIDVPEDLRWALGDEVGSLLAVSLEPEGGAPAGVPTGPIVAKGGI
jgi:anti-sigma-K factor RskA